MQVSPQRYRTVALAALWSVTAIIVTGASVRVTGSGLGCTDWPNCHSGSLVPTEAATGHTFIEFINRLFTGVLALTTAGAVLASWFRQPRRRDLVIWSIVVAAFIPIQIVVGGISVLTDLHPAAVAAHFLLSIPVAGAGIILWRQAGLPDEITAEVAPEPADLTSGGQLRFKLSIAMVISTFVVMIAGSMVTGTGPHGGDPEAQRFAFSALSAVRIHGALVWVLLLEVVLFAWLSRNISGPSGRRAATRCLIAVFFQGSLGYLQWWNDIPAGLVLLHVFGSVMVWLAMVDCCWWMVQSRKQNMITTPQIVASR